MYIAALAEPGERGATGFGTSDDEKSTRYFPLLCFARCSSSLNLSRFAPLIQGQSILLAHVFKARQPTLEHYRENVCEKETGGIGDAATHTRQSPTHHTGLPPSAFSLSSEELSQCSIKAATVGAVLALIRSTLCITSNSTASHCASDVTARRGGRRRTSLTSLIGKMYR